MSVSDHSAIIKYTFTKCNIECRSKYERNLFKKRWSMLYREGQICPGNVSGALTAFIIVDTQCSSVWGWAENLFSARVWGVGGGWGVGGCGGGLLFTFPSSYESSAITSRLCTRKEMERLEQWKVQNLENLVNLVSGVCLLNWAGMANHLQLPPTPDYVWKMHQPSKKMSASII